jgi:hypothetical protein
MEPELSVTITTDILSIAPVEGAKRRRQKQAGREKYSIDKRFMAHEPASLLEDCSKSFEGYQKLRNLIRDLRSNSIS